MSAILTDAIKKQLLQDVLADFAEPNTRYYAGLGRSEDWDAEDVAAVPVTSPRDVRNARLGMQAVKNITDMTFCVTRSNWSLGATYSAYDDDFAGYPANSYYVMNTSQQVYLCLRQGSSNSNNGSSEQPVGNVNGRPFRTSDGYVWKFMYSIGALKASKFLSSAFMPVEFVASTDSDSLSEVVEQKLVQDNAIVGQIVGYAVVNPGLNYSSTPVATVSGNGVGAFATPVIVGGQLTRLDVKTDSAGNILADYVNNSYYGKGYDYASVVFSGGGTGEGAVVRPIFATKGGFGADARDDMKSAQLMFNTKIIEGENDEFLINQDFRQVLLLRNPLFGADSDGLFTESVGSTLHKLGVSSINSGPFVNDVIIEGQSSLAKAYIDDTDSATIWYHQTEATGFKSFSPGETIESSAGATTGIVGATLQGKVDPLSGELLYIDNRAAVLRSADQTEDIKIVIQL
tara:strand:- start:15390 stop:16763 length:1374 start_codon:yes stop_codon:yes gene_type:complete